MNKITIASMAALMAFGISACNRTSNEPVSPAGQAPSSQPPANAPAPESGTGAATPGSPNAGTPGTTGAPGDPANNKPQGSQ